MSTCGTRIVAFLSLSLIMCAGCSAETDTIEGARDVDSVVFRIPSGSRADVRHVVRSRDSIRAIRAVISRLDSGQWRPVVEPVSRLTVTAQLFSGNDAVYSLALSERQDGGDSATYFVVTQDATTRERRATQEQVVAFLMAIGRFSLINMP